MPSLRAKIKDITIRNVLDSDGDPCLEVEVLLDDGTRAYESSPLGTTTAKYDAKLISSSEIMRSLPVVRNQLLRLAADDQLTVDKVIPESSL